MIARCNDDIDRIRFDRAAVPDDELPYMEIVSVVDLPFESLTVADVVPVPELSTFFDVLY